MLSWLAGFFRRRRVAWVEADDLRRRLARGETPVIVDVREPDEFDGPLGHIPGARNIPLAQVPMQRDELAASGDAIVFVCLTDKRSSQAAAEIAAVRTRGVGVLRGGMKAWRTLDAAPGSA